MKKSFLMAAALFCFTWTAFADDSQALSPQAMESLQQQVREMNALGIPEAQAMKMLTRMVQNGFQEETRILAQKVVEETAMAGLPTDPVISKALEGMAKKVREQNIIQAMEAVRNRYAYANEVAKSLSTDKKNADIMAHAIADSLAAGMQEKDMEAVSARLQILIRQQTRNRADNDSLAIQTMQTARTMTRMGMASFEVSDTLCRALQKNDGEGEINRLRRTMEDRKAESDNGGNSSPGNAGSGNTGNASSGAGSGGSSSSGSGNGSGGTSSGGSGDGSGSGSGGGSGGRK